MGCSAREPLLAVKGVGPAVVSCLEQIGLRSLAELADADAGDLVVQIAAVIVGTCWRNSPQARAAIAAAITMARRQRHTYKKPASARSDSLSH